MMLLLMMMMMKNGTKVLLKYKHKTIDGE